MIIGEYDMQNGYYLFLDETKPNAHGSYFALGSYAIRREDYESILKPQLEKIKSDLMPDPELPLHLYDMRKNIKGFEFLSDVNVRNSLFDRIKNLVQSLDISVFVASIDTEKYKKMYYEKTNDSYRLLIGGTLFINSDTIMKNLSILSFPLKSDNNLGVQLADFIPVSFVRNLIGSKDYCGLYKLFESKLYRGYGRNMEGRFGFKKLLEWNTCSELIYR